jgi:hypothetical protein
MVQIGMDPSTNRKNHPKARKEEIIQGRQGSIKIELPEGNHSLRRRRYLHYLVSPNTISHVYDWLVRVEIGLSSVRA